MNVIKNFVLRSTLAVFCQVFLIYILVLSLIGQIGCIPPAAGQNYQSLPVLYAILTEDQSTGVSKYRVAAGSERRNVWVMRRGIRLDATPNMALHTGDEIRTGSSSAVAIRFPNGSQLYLKSNTHIRIGSVFAFVGELFVRVKGAFQVDTEFVTAGAEGTEWVMNISPDGDTRCMVLKGRVRVASKENSWKPMSVIANRLSMTYGPKPSWTGVVASRQELFLAPQQELNKTKYWIDQMDRLTQEP